MSQHASVVIDAPAERIWSELIDVERWPLFTASISRVERLDQGSLHHGSRARIKQPSLPPVVWTVTDFQPLVQFTWCVRFPGATTIATHALSAGPSGGITLTLSIDRNGWLAPVLDVFYARLTQRYLTMEAAGMKRACEVGTASAAA